jgi:DNA-binding NarL/FixJ family response regulator
MSTRTDPGRAPSPRELQIADLVAASLANGQTAGWLASSPRTVKARLRNAHANTSAASRTQLCIWLRGGAG